MRPRLLFASILGLAAATAVWSCATAQPTDDGSGPGDDDGEGPTSGPGGASPTSSGGGSDATSSGTGGAGAGACTESPCKIVPPQCGCGPDEQCTVGVPTSDNPTGRFCDVAGDIAVGQACSSNDKCVEGSMCIDAGGVSACLEFCANDTNCDAPGGVCLLTIADGDGTVPSATLCSTNCDPSTNVGCNVPSSGCAIGQDEATMKPFSVCVGAGNGMQDAPCTSNLSCAPTFGCFTVGGEMKCLKYCGYSPASGTCPMGAVCTPFSEPLVLGTQEYGVCQ